MNHSASNHRARRSWQRAIITLCVGSLAAVMGIACSTDADRSFTGSGPTNTLQGSCEDGQQRQCGYTVKQSHDIRSCYRGTQYCQEGRWGACIEGEITDEPNTKDTRFGEYDPQIISSVTAMDCADPCDPACMEFIEVPPAMGGATSMGGAPNYTPPTCDHDLCVEGTALDSACDPCVGQVCAVDPACCSVSWNDACVDKTFTECVNQPPPFGLCDFGLFTEDSITTSNRPASGVAIGANANVTIGTDATPSTIVVGGNLTIQSPNGATVDTPGGVWAGGDISVQAGSSTSYNGDWSAGGAIDIAGGNTINGDVYAQFDIGGQLTAIINGDASAGSIVDNTIEPDVSGVVTEGSTHAAPNIQIPSAIPERTTTCPGTVNINFTGGQTANLLPGDYGNWNMSNGNNVLELAPGNYTVNSISAAGANGGTPNVIRLNGTSTDKWDITVCGNSSLGNWFEIQDSSGNVLSDPAQLVMYFGGSVTAGTDSSLAGVVMVPNGTFTSGDRTSVDGALWAETINAGTDLNATGINKSDCEALGITTPPTITTCPITVSSEPILNEPCESGQDCQINHRCEEVSTGGTCSHDKCTTGFGLDPACGDECVEQICAFDASCCDVSNSTAWSSTCVGYVNTVCDAFCGSGSGAGNCVSNLDGFQDSTCAGYDLALDFPCDDLVPVCNHGSAPFSGTLQIGYWEEADGQVSTSTPDTSIMDIFCSGSVTIAPGTCEDVTCPAPSTNDYTGMVDPFNGLTECNNHRDDNWTWDDGGACTAPTTYEYEYEADCPDDTTAQWKNLTWISTVPTGSKIDFSVAVADSFGDLSTATYTPVGTAQPGSPDTQVCALSGPSPDCPVLLTDELSLGNQQGQFFGIRVQTDPSGGSPTLDDWTVSYTCVFDQ